MYDTIEMRVKSGFLGAIRGWDTAIDVFDIAHMPASMPRSD